MGSPHCTFYLPDGWDLKFYHLVFQLSVEAQQSIDMIIQPGTDTPTITQTQSDAGSVNTLAFEPVACNRGCKARRNVLPC